MEDLVDLGRIVFYLWEVSSFYSASSSLRQIQRWLLLILSFMRSYSFWLRVLYTACLLFLSIIIYAHSWISFTFYCCFIAIFFNLSILPTSLFYSSLKRATPSTKPSISFTSDCVAVSICQFVSIFFFISSSILNRTVLISLRLFSMVSSYSLFVYSREMTSYSISLEWASQRACMESSDSHIFFSRWDSSSLKSKPLCTFFSISASWFGWCCGKPSLS